MKQQLPSDRLTRPRRPLRTVLIAAGAAVVLAGVGVGAAVAAPAVFPQPTPTRTVAFVPAPQTGSVNRAPAVTAGQEQTAMAQAQKMATDKATADAAAQAVAQKTATKSQTVSTPVRCPVGSTANSNDGVNDTSCFPDICFHIQVPDPAHPECNTAFKP